MKWRCEDCYPNPCYCTTCCRSVHERSPFHRVSRWDGKTFYPSALRKTGLTLYLGHRGMPCPSIHADDNPSPSTTPASSIHPTPTVSPSTPPLTSPDDDIVEPLALPPSVEQYIDIFEGAGFNDPLPFHSPTQTPPHSSPATSPLTSPQSHPASPPLDVPLSSTTSRNRKNVEDILDSDDIEVDEEWMEFEKAGLSTSSLRYPRGRDPHGNMWLTVVDTSGVHHLPVHYCDCDSSAKTHIQLLRMGLYPVSYDRPQTVFTFRVLDDFELENLETKCSAQSYFAKLKRLTSDAFPHTVPDRYRERCCVSCGSGVT